MIRYLKHYTWFLKESRSFMNDVIFWGLIRKGILRKAHFHAKGMCKWDKLTAKQKEAWYLSGEDRVMEI